MDHFQHIYNTRADAYHAMIAAEDVDGNLLPAIRSITPLEGKRVLDLGTGTGRLPILLSHLAGQVIGIELYRAMLRENLDQRQLFSGQWDLVQADMRRLPLPDGWAEVTLAGWAIGHMRGWFPENWQEQIGRVLDEMQRVTTAGGVLIILETLGTGSLQPAPPTPELAEYYAWLEGTWGFQRKAFPTDYQFENVESAVARTQFFFGSGLAGQIRERGWQRLPEWTGLWSWRRPGEEA